MKCFLRYLFVLLIPFGSLLADKTDDAIKYSNVLIEEQNKVAIKFMALTEAFNKRNVDVLDKKLDSLKDQVGLSMKNISKMKGFDGNTRFLNAMKALIGYYKELCNNDLKILMKIYKKNTVTLTNEEMSIVDSLTKSIESRELPIVNEIDLAQKEFARKYKFLIGRNRLQNEISELDVSNKQINAAIDYNDSIVFLQSRFTKSLIQFTNILQDNVTEQVDRSFSEMKIILNQSVKDMEKIKDFQGDYDFRNATMEYFTSFVKLMDGDFTVFVELIRNKAGFSEESTKTYNELVYSLPKRIDEYENKFIEAQKQFAQRYNIFLFNKFDEKKKNSQLKTEGNSKKKKK